MCLEPHWRVGAAIRSTAREFRSRTGRIDLASQVHGPDRIPAHIPDRTFHREPSTTRSRRDGSTQGLAGQVSCSRSIR